MSQRKHRIVLFLCTGNYYRSRFAEIAFNSLAEKMGLAWRASSRGLALERGVNNVGPIAPSVVKALQLQGIRAPESITRFPMQVVLEDLEQADWIVALKEAEHLPLLHERFPDWAGKVESWQVDDAPAVLALIEREVSDLAARLIGGGRPRDSTARDISEPISPNPLPKQEAASNSIVRVGRATKGKRGKGVTTVSDLPLDEAGLSELAAQLKQLCGTGGTVKDGRIEIQGDHRERLIHILQGMGYRVKRAGG